MTSALFTPLGLHALRGLAGRRSALVFDLDGTLAPIMPRPGDARVPAPTAARLHAVSRLWPVAVLTGRSVGDAADRLGFDPKCLYGNHGAQRRGLQAPRSLAHERALDPVRARLQSGLTEMHRLGIEVEDKGLSLALHYRRSPRHNAAREYLGDLLQHHSSGLRAEDGHCVLNLMAADAPDKGDALREVLDEWSLDSALVVGDDSNDEPAFAAAPAGSVSVRIGDAGRTTAALFTLEKQTQVDVLLDLLLRLRRATPEPT